MGGDEDKRRPLPRNFVINVDALVREKGVACLACMAPRGLLFEQLTPRRLIAGTVSFILLATEYSEET